MPFLSAGLSGPELGVYRPLLDLFPPTPLISGAVATV